MRAFEAGDDPDRGLMYVIGEMFSGGKHSLEPLPARARGRFTRSIPWGHLLVPRTFLYKALTVSLTFGSRMTRKRQRWRYQDDELVGQGSRR